MHINRLVAEDPTYHFNIIDSVFSNDLSVHTAERSAIDNVLNSVFTVQDLNSVFITVTDTVLINDTALNNGCSVTDQVDFNSDYTDTVLTDTVFKNTDTADTVLKNDTVPTAGSVLSPKITGFYTNIDSLSNKMSELRAAVLSNDQPDVIALTEIKPKNSRYPLTKSEIHLENYELFTSGLDKHDSRGIAIYIHNRVAATEIDKHTDTKETLFLQVDLAGGNKLLIACFYRSPNSGEENNTNINTAISSLSTGFTHVLACGDFNYPGVDWTSLTANGNNRHDTNLFIEAVQDSFLYQHVTSATRARGNNDPSLLDLVFTNEENMVSDMDCGAPIGKSDHASITFTYHCYVEPSAGFNTREVTTEPCVTP